MLTNAPSPRSLASLQHTDEFIGRHIGPNEGDIHAMLAELQLGSLTELIEKTVPDSIALKRPLALGKPATETAVLARLKAMVSQDEPARSFIGLGYYDTLTPNVILRNVLENPGWYTAYTPYQPEMSQGRLESLLAFQQMILDLSGMDLANASLLDEATAAAEAMALAKRVSRSDANAFFVDNAMHRGRLIEQGTGEPSVEGVRSMMDAIRRHPRLKAAGIQTVGAKGYDGMVLALVGDAPRAAGDPLDILLRHDAWATREVLRACSGLTDEQWHRRFEIGPGSLHDALTHVVGAMLRWADRIDGPPTELRPSIEGIARRTPAELLAILEAAESGLAASADRARARGLGTEFDVTLAGRTHRFMLGTALVHVTTHGMHHRAQCLNMLRHMGVPGISDRLPEIDPLDWQLQAQA